MSQRVVGLISDLFFVAPLETALKRLGYHFHSFETPVPSTDLESTGSLKPGEPLTGPAADFVTLCVELHPVLVVVELNSPLPWPRLIAALKSSSATRRLPVIAFGPHTDLALRARALDVGCDAVIAQGRFLSALPELIQKHAHTIDAEAIAADCQTPLSAQARHGLELFNRGEFFEAHEELEHAWNADSGPARELYRGVLQVAVAYLHITRGNYVGARKMFLRMRQWLDPLPAVCRGINVAQLRADALAAQTELERLGAERLAEFDATLLKPVQYTA